MAERAKRLSLLGLRGDKGRDPEVTGIAVDSRQIRPGFLFAALPGSAQPGGEFIPYALRQGAVAVLTRLRSALIGYKPPNCRRKVWAVGEQFLGESAGIWQYALDVATEAIVVEDEDVDTGPLLTHITTADPYNRGETRKEPDGTIIQEEFTV